MKWRKLCEETPSIGQDCLCRRDWGNEIEPTYRILSRCHCALFGDCWESVDTDEEPQP